MPQVLIFLVKIGTRNSTLISAASYVPEVRGVKCYLIAMLLVLALVSEGSGVSSASGLLGEAGTWVS